MRRTPTRVAAAVLFALAAGCGGDGLLRTSGRVVKAGQRFVPEEGQYLQITFVPIAPDGTPPADFYYAEVDQTTGTFRPAGKTGRGMPPGKYRVAVELMKKKKDQLDGRFDAEKSPFVFDVDGRTAEIVLDLDNPPR
jgi:hypothetical protein